MANNLEFIPYSISNGQIVFDHIKGVDLWETTLSNNVYPPSTENYNTAVKNWEYSGTNYNPRPELTSLFKYNGQYITREIFSSSTGTNTISTIGGGITFTLVGGNFTKGNRPDRTDVFTHSITYPDNKINFIRGMGHSINNTVTSGLTSDLSLAAKYNLEFVNDFLIKFKKDYPNEDLNNYTGLCMDIDGYVNITGISEGPRTPVSCRFIFGFDNRASVEMYDSWSVNNTDLLFTKVKVLEEYLHNKQTWLAASFSPTDTPLASTKEKANFRLGLLFANAPINNYINRVNVNRVILVKRSKTDPDNYLNEVDIENVGSVSIFTTRSTFSSHHVPASRVRFDIAVSNLKTVPIFNKATEVLKLKVEFAHGYDFYVDLPESILDELHALTYTVNSLVINTPSNDILDTNYNTPNWLTLVKDEIETNTIIGKVVYTLTSDNIYIDPSNLTEDNIATYNSVIPYSVEVTPIITNKKYKVVITGVTTNNSLNTYTINNIRLFNGALHNHVFNDLQTPVGYQTAPVLISTVSLLETINPYLEEKVGSIRLTFNREINEHGNLLVVDKNGSPWCKNVSITREDNNNFLVNYTSIAGHNYRLNYGETFQLKLLNINSTLNGIVMNSIDEYLIDISDSIFSPTSIPNDFLTISFNETISNISTGKLAFDLSPLHRWDYNYQNQLGDSGGIVPTFSNLAGNVTYETSVIVNPVSLVHTAIIQITSPLNTSLLALDINAKFINTEIKTFTAPIGVVPVVVNLAVAEDPILVIKYEQQLSDIVNGRAIFTVYSSNGIDFTANINDFTIKGTIPDTWETENIFNKELTRNNTGNYTLRLNCKNNYFTILSGDVIVQFNGRTIRKPITESGIKYLCFDTTRPTANYSLLPQTSDVLRYTFTSLISPIAKNDAALNVIQSEPNNYVAQFKDLKLSDFAVLTTTNTGAINTDPSTWNKLSDYFDLDSPIVNDNNTGILNATLRRKILTEIKIVAIALLPFNINPLVLGSRGRPVLYKDNIKGFNDYTTELIKVFTSVITLPSLISNPEVTPTTPVNIHVKASAFQINDDEELILTLTCTGKLFSMVDTVMVNGVPTRSAILKTNIYSNQLNIIELIESETNIYKVKCKTKLNTFPCFTDIYLVNVVDINGNTPTINGNKYPNIGVGLQLSQFTPISLLTIGINTQISSPNSALPPGMLTYKAPLIIRVNQKG